MHHDQWIRFRDQHSVDLSETKLSPIAFRSETRFRNLLDEGLVTSAAGETAELQNMGVAAWAALERFALYYFREFESYEPLEQFRELKNEVARRGTGFRGH
jgi:hypothetical protein